uniref:Uncharacterized protein n=1 Tax=Rhizophora mucronata TaxID=61149 RepID=A0A2P2JVV8_RHIMU
MFLCFFFWVHFGGFSVGLHGIFRWFLRKKLFGFFTGQFLFFKIFFFLM